MVKDIFSTLEPGFVEASSQKVRQQKAIQRFRRKQRPTTAQVNPTPINLPRKKKSKRTDIYRRARSVLKSYKQEQQYEQNLSRIKQAQREETFSKSRSGKIGRGIQKVFGAIRNPARATYSQPAFPQTSRRTRRPSYSGGKRGRPFGTVKYRDPKTGQAIGVYEYRKILAARLRQERLQNYQRSVVNPQQQAVLDRIRQREQAQSMNEEAQTIPTTKGKVQLRGIMDEINDAANIFP